MPPDVTEPPVDEGEPPVDMPPIGIMGVKPPTGPVDMVPPVVPPRSSDVPPATSVLDVPPLLEVDCPPDESSAEAPPSGAPPGNSAPHANINAAAKKGIKGRITLDVRLFILAVPRFKMTVFLHVEYLSNKPVVALIKLANLVS